jgi:hypothetical protein
VTISCQVSYIAVTRQLTEASAGTGITVHVELPKRKPTLTRLTRLAESEFFHRPR